ncbi:hypothetical protein L1276_001288 [Flavobacterium sp. HSC-32F16]|uniref:hypothetical protein n=1 Tax=Flavobacterium sp. HSC-32F16 TaxID=2910964 RepID=UPI0020A61B69|nr:hypothetical protein [Flavobacterium sp. HSC-32F16]MCP2026148.1 hypothetical protein [Flavobacterium sp. HSC-32F16]
MEIVIEEVLFWMDGGTITLKMKKDNSVFYEVEFVQKMLLEKSTKDYVKPTPGSLRFDGKDVDIRSELEKKLLLEIKIAEFGPDISKKERDSFKRVILEAIDFVESEDYIAVAQKVGRIK